MRVNEFDGDISYYSLRPLVKNIKRKYLTNIIGKVSN